MLRKREMNIIIHRFGWFAIRPVKVSLCKTASICMEKLGHSFLDFER
jgi:hypothetical protein